MEIGRPSNPLAPPALLTYVLLSPVSMIRNASLVYTWCPPPPTIILPSGVSVST